MALEKTTAALLIRRHKTLTIAESCTGGLLTHRLTNVPGSSKFLKAAVVVYSNEAKNRLLGIPPRLLRRYGAVSKQTATAMAQGARRIFKTDIGIGITGIAGPSGATELKPIGLVHIALSDHAGTLCLECRLKGNRLNVKRQATTQALRLLQKSLS